MMEIYIFVLKKWKEENNKDTKKKWNRKRRKIEK